MARRRKGRLLDGVLILNKPTGRSSNSALQAARAMYQAQKAGHTGSLLDADKAYTSTFILGAGTDTADSEGQIIESADASHLTLDMIEEAVSEFRGAILQLPPMFSALKKNGVPLYQLARQGIEVEREPRPVTIHEYLISDFRPGVRAELDVTVRCSKGTYIRSLASDLGHALGVGGHVSALHRTQAGRFSIEQATKLSDLQVMTDAGNIEQMDALLLPADAAVETLPKIILDEESARYMLLGNHVMVAKAPLDNDFRLYTELGKFIGMGFVRDDGMVGARRLISTSEA